MINVLRNYIEQRIHIGLLLSLCVFIMLYSVPVSSLNAWSISAFAFLFLVVVCFRLYDDLMQVSHDAGKMNRDYTDPSTRKTLSYFVLAFLSVLIGIAFLVRIEFGFLLLGFSLINHIAYVFLVNNRIASGLLPLLKYPFLFYMLQFCIPSSIDIGYIQALQALALYLSFVAFESMEDATFAVSRSYSYILQILSFVLLMPGNGALFITLFGIGLVMISLFVNYFKWKSAPYIFFLFILIFKILQYEI